MLSGLIRIFGALARALLDGSFLRRREFDTCPPGFREADGDGLFWRSGAMLAATDPFDFLVHELAGLRGRRLACALGAPSLLDCPLLRHCPSPAERRDAIRTDGKCTRPDSRLDASH